MLRSPAGPRQQEDAGRIPIQAMYQPRALVGTEAQGIQHAVEMTGNTGSSLDGKSCRLVKRNEVIVLVEDAVRQRCDVPSS